MFYVWLSGGKFQSEPEEAAAQAHWLKRLLLEDEEAAREWQEMGRPLPNASEVPPRRGRNELQGSHAVGAPASRFLWASPTFLAEHARDTRQVCGDARGSCSEGPWTATEAAAHALVELSQGSSAAATEGERRAEQMDLEERLRVSAAPDTAPDEPVAERPVDLRSVDLGDFVLACIARASSGSYAAYPFGWARRGGRSD